jgi:hypothetical protein
MQGDRVNRRWFLLRALQEFGVGERASQPAAPRRAQQYSHPATRFIHPRLGTDERGAAAGPLKGPSSPQRAVKTGAGAEFSARPAADGVAGYGVLPPVISVHKNVVAKKDVEYHQTPYTWKAMSGYARNPAGGFLHS